MLRRFLRDRRGNYLMITALIMPVLFGSLTIGIDYADMSRQRQNMLNALDAAGMATSRRLLEGGTDTVVRTYARDFFNANLNGVSPKDVTLTVTLPANISGGGRVRLDAVLKYNPYFLEAFLGLLGKNAPDLYSRASTVVQLKNTVEVALVLDNSGSMDYLGTDSGKKRIELLKSAASQLVDQLAQSAKLMAQVEKPVQFAVVPFAASVNVGSSNKNEPWMDPTGISPIHHENFDWTMTAADKKVEQNGSSGPYYKKGNGWPAEERGQTVTRISLLKDLKRYVCSNGGISCRTPTVVSANLSWDGCVESRPDPYNTNDEKPTAPETLYVPMFAPDEAGDLNYGGNKNSNLISFSADNSWWNDAWQDNGTTSAYARKRQRNGAKYFVPLPKEVTSVPEGPNSSCTTTAITSLTDVTTSAGLKTVKDAIAAMGANGATNVPEGLAWGWRTLSSQVPFTGGRAETERGNDKVIIALTDGANTYYRPSVDTAGNESTYSAYGYAYLFHKNKPGRIFDGTSSAVSKTDFTNDNYAKAMNEHFLKTCENANGADTGKPGAGIIIMTVALDLDPDKKPTDPRKPATAAERKQTEAQLAMLKQCASRSRYAKDPTDSSKGRKLFWNATGGNLDQVFREIADELSNLRFVM